MDDNTTKVLMALISLISAVVTPLVVVFVNRKTNKKVDANCRKLEVVEDKLDESHKQMNGNLDKLIKTTAELATAQEKARAKKQ